MVKLAGIGGNTMTKPILIILISLFMLPNANAVVTMCKKKITYTSPSSCGSYTAPTASIQTAYPVVADQRWQTLRYGADADLMFTAAVMPL